MDDVKLTLVDLNPKMIDAWLGVFDGEPNVEVVRGSLLDEHVDAWIAPTNARAQMNGGLDAAIRAELGAGIQARVRRSVQSEHGDFIPVGRATCVRTGRSAPAWLVSTPTMVGAADEVSSTKHVALACGAALQAVCLLNRAMPGSVRSVAMPGLGAGTGRVPHAVCAELMWAAYQLFSSQLFHTFDDMRAALEYELGELDHGERPSVWTRTRGPVLPKPYHGGPHARA